MEPLREVGREAPQRPWWRRHLTNGLMVIYCLLLLVAAGAIFKNCSVYFDAEECLETGGHWENQSETCIPR